MGVDRKELFMRLEQGSLVLGAVHDGPNKKLIPIPEDAQQIRLYYLPGCAAGCLGLFFKVKPWHQYIGVLNFENDARWEVKYCNKRDAREVRHIADGFQELFNVTIDTILEN